LISQIKVVAELCKQESVRKRGTGVLKNYGGWKSSSCDYFKLIEEQQLSFSRLRLQPLFVWLAGYIYIYK
jgi:hypothetical protein